MYQLEAALILSPGNKAQTMKNDRIYVVERQYTLNDHCKHTHTLYAIQGNTVLFYELYPIFKDFADGLKRFGIEHFVPIWHPIGYTIQ